MAQTQTPSDIRFTLNEASYFFEQMEKNTDNSAHFIYNLIAFVGATRNLILTIQHRFKPWYNREMKDDLEKNEDFEFFSSSKAEFFQEGSLRKDVFANVSKAIIIRYDIESETTKDNKLTEGHSGAPTETPSTIVHNPTADEEEKYVWRFRSFRGKSITLLCAEYLKKLEIIVNQCERDNPINPAK